MGNKNVFIRMSATCALLRLQFLPKDFGAAAEEIYRCCNGQGSMVLHGIRVDLCEAANVLKGHLDSASDNPQWRKGSLEVIGIEAQLHTINDHG